MSQLHNPAKLPMKQKIHNTNAPDSQLLCCQLSGKYIIPTINDRTTGERTAQMGPSLLAIARYSRITPMLSTWISSSLLQCGHVLEKSFVPFLGRTISQRNRCFCDIQVVRSIPDTMFEVSSWIIVKRNV